MDRVTDQQKAVDPRSARKADVDVHTEHDPEVSRRLSNAGLRREEKRVAEASKEPLSEQESTKLISTSNATTKAAVAATLTHLASQLHEWSTELQQITTSTAGDVTVGAAKITSIYDSAMSQIEQAAHLIPLTGNQRYGLQDQVKVVTGAVFMFHVQLANAVKWASAHQQHLKIDVDAPSMKVEAYARLIDVDPKKIGRDTAPPKGNVNALATEMVAKELGALEASLDALKTGDNIEPARLVAQAQHLAAVTSAHPTSKSDKAKYTTLLRKLAAISDGLTREQHTLVRETLERIAK